jgi:hypothetical protein
MGVIGKTPWLKTVAISILVPLVVFILFDKIFLIPLPEGIWGKGIIPSF